MGTGTGEARLTVCHEEQKEGLSTGTGVSAVQYSVTSAKREGSMGAVGTHRKGKRRTLRRQ